jgi:chromosomal replication initiation ATPase DnaA
MRVYLSLWHGLQPWPYPENWHAIAAGIAHDHGLTFEDITGPSRSDRVSRARQHVMYALSKRGNSSAWIGRQLGREHSTVLYGIDAHKRRVSDFIARACGAEEKEKKN